MSAGKQRDLSSDVKNSEKLVSLTGITPSSAKGLHLGNYLGAVKPSVAYQDQADCLYFIADYHALNTVFDPKELAANVVGTYLDYLALGIDLDATVFFIESYISEINELTEILKNVVSLAEMKRMHAFKDKLADEDADVNSINMGLFTYPILMAADILVFKPDVIPVGEDQAQHIEVARSIARSFNARYGDVLKLPQAKINKSVARVPGTDGERKMSKSLGNDLTIFADEADIKKQVMSIQTDPNRIRKDDPGDPTKNVIFTYLRLMDYDKDEILQFEERYRAGTIGDVELKQIFFEFFLDYFAEFRQKRAKLAQDIPGIRKQMQEQSQIAQEIAAKNLVEIKTAIGLWS